MKRTTNNFHNPQMVSEQYVSGLRQFEGEDRSKCRLSVSLLQVTPREWRTTQLPRRSGPMSRADKWPSRKPVNKKKNGPMHSKQTL